MCPPEAARLGDDVGSGADGAGPLAAPRCRTRLSTRTRSLLWAGASSDEWRARADGTRRGLAPCGRAGCRRGEHADGDQLLHTEVWRTRDLGSLNLRVRAVARRRHPPPEGGERAAVRSCARRTGDRRRLRDAGRPGHRTAAGRHGAGPLRRIDAARVSQRGSQDRTHLGPRSVEGLADLEIADLGHVDRFDHRSLLTACNDFLPRRARGPVLPLRHSDPPSWHHHTPTRRRTLHGDRTQVP